MQAASSELREPPECGGSWDGCSSGGRLKMGGELFPLAMFQMLKSRHGTVCVGNCYI